MQEHVVTSLIDQMQRLGNVVGGVDTRLRQLENNDRQRAQDENYHARLENARRQNQHGDGFARGEYFDHDNFYSSGDEGTDNHANDRDRSRPPVDPVHNRQHRNGLQADPMNQSTRHLPNQARYPYGQSRRTHDICNLEHY